MNIIKSSGTRKQTKFIDDDFDVKIPPPPNSQWSSSVLKNLNSTKQMQWKLHTSRLPFATCRFRFHSCKWGFVQLLPTATVSCFVVCYELFVICVPALPHPLPFPVFLWFPRGSTSWCRRMKQANKNHNFQSCPEKAQQRNSKYLLYLFCADLCFLRTNHPSNLDSIIYRRLLWQSGEHTEPQDGLPEPWVL